MLVFSLKGLNHFKEKSAFSGLSIAKNIRDSV